MRERKVWRGRSTLQQSKDSACFGEVESPTWTRDVVDAINSGRRSEVGSGKHRVLLDQLNLQQTDLQ